MKNLVNIVPFAVLVCGLLGALLLPSLPEEAAAEQAPMAGSSPDEWTPDTKVLAATWYFLMGMAHAAGANNSTWRSSAEVCNFGGSQVNVEIRYLNHDANNSNPQREYYNIGSYNCRRWDDALADMFGVNSGKGSLLVYSANPGIKAAGRTYNAAVNGTFGQFCPGDTTSAAVTPGAQGVIFHLSHSTNMSTGYRTNLSLQNTTSSQATVTIEVFLADGTFLGQTTETLKPYEFEQIVGIFTRVTAYSVDDGYVIITTNTSGAAVLANASVVDNVTGDGTTIPMYLIP